MTELTVLAVRNARPKAKPYRMMDGKGLYLQVMPGGAKYWRLRYRFGGREKMLSVGVYPDTSLAKAREKRDAARAMLADGLDPSDQRKAAKVATLAADERSLRAQAEEWLVLQQPNWSDSYHERVKTALVRDVYPFLGARPIGSIEPRDLLTVLQRVQQRGAKETGHRLRRWLSPVFRYAIVKGLAERDPCADLKGALAAIDRGKMPTITDPSGIGELMRAIDGYQGTYVVRAALALSPLVFTRPGELRWAKWPEFDLVKATWTIPAARMKMRKAAKAKAPPHVVPLSRQALAILHNLYPITGHGKGQYVFPGVRDSTRPISENTINAALHRLGFKGQIVAHGFRHMASTALNEAGWDDDAIERQLAHTDTEVRGVYNLAKYLPERRAMMQAWADYLDTLRHSTERDQTFEALSRRAGGTR